MASRTARIEALHAFMSDAGFDAQLSTRIAQDLWNKWILLATLGGICALARGNVGEIAATDGGDDLVRAFLAEAAAVADGRRLRAEPAGARVHRWACSRPPARR